MELPGKKCQRLLSALESLATDEEALLQAGDIEGVRDVQRRFEAIMVGLGEIIGGSALSPAEKHAALPRLERLQLRRAAAAENLGKQLAEMEPLLMKLDEATYRLRATRSAYGAPSDRQRASSSKVSFSA